MIEHVIRRVQNGKRSQYWTGRYSLGRGHPPREVALGLKDEASARAALRQIVEDAQREAYGLLPKKSYREAAATSISALLDAYETDLTAQHRSPGHVKESIARIRRVVVACKWRRLRDVSPPRFLAWRASLDRSPKTIKEYQVSLNAFLNWLVDTERLERNPLKRVPFPETRGKSVRPTRALTLDELRALFTASGDNALFYMTLAYTGQRYSEIAALVWGDVVLGKDPFIRVREETTKDMDARAIPLITGLAEKLRAARPDNAAPDTKVFPDAPSLEKFYTDLKRAGIARKDALGRVVHLHALRKTFQTMGVQAGVNQRAAQEFLGHSDANLTAKIYTDVPALGLRDEMEKLEWWEKAEDPENAKSRQEVTKPAENAQLITQLKTLVRTLEVLDSKGLQNQPTNFSLAARHGFLPVSYFLNIVKIGTGRNACATFQNRRHHFRLQYLPLPRLQYKHLPSLPRQRTAKKPRVFPDAAVRNKPNKPVAIWLAWSKHPALSRGFTLCVQRKVTQRITLGKHPESRGGQQSAYHHRDSCRSGEPALPQQPPNPRVVPMKNNSSANGNQQDDMQNQRLMQMGKKPADEKCQLDNKAGHNRFIVVRVV